MLSYWHAPKAANKESGFLFLFLGAPHAPNHACHHLFKAMSSLGTYDRCRQKQEGEGEGKWGAHLVNMAWWLLTSMYGIIHPLTRLRCE